MQAKNALLRVYSEALRITSPVRQNKKSECFRIRFSLACAGDSL
jgi:hypothetical protein